MFRIFISVVLLKQAFMFNLQFKDVQNCTCVPYYQCSDETGNLLVDGKGLLDLRMDYGPCKGYFDVCCNGTTEIIEDNPVQKDFKGCGYQNGGFFPWTAALLIQEYLEFPSSYVCGASLIHKRVLVTAAHCLKREGYWSVRVGNVHRTISKIIIHPLFNNASLQNDLALLILDKSIDLSEKINTICIPPIGTSLDQMKCTATARINKNQGSYLKMVKLPMVSQEKCLNLLRGTRLGPFFQLHSSFICAGGLNNEDTCSGDGGSPLVCPVPGQPGRYHQVGIVSWGIGCGKNNIPGVYVRLALFRDWIDEVLLKNGLDIISYRY